MKISFPVLIEQKIKNILIHTADGTEFSADRVLCTVPLTVLKKINFVEDKSIVSGCIVKLGSTMIDFSTKSKLDKIVNLLR